MWIGCKIWDNGQEAGGSEENDKGWKFRNMGHTRSDWQCETPGPQLSLWQGDKRSPS